MSRPLAESVSLAEATTSTDTTGGVLEVEFITPGWGSSGYYSRDVVEAAAPLFAVGTHMYFDHPTENEDRERPARSVRDLCAVITESAFDAESGGIRGRVRPLAPYRDLLLDEAFATSVGLSIRGSATDITVGEAEGRQGPIIEGLADIASVDFVTRAGRGGRVLAVLESAPAEEVTARAIAHGVEEATADERRTQLSDTVRATYGSENAYAWVQDFDDTRVWFQVSPDDAPAAYWEQTYTVADDDLSVTLTGERAAVRPVTRYLPLTPDGGVAEGTDDPVTRPGTQQEDTMPQIEESELARLREADGRVPTLESERDTAAGRATAAEAERDALARRDRARDVLAESEHMFAPLEIRGLLADLPVAEGGVLDEEAFTTRLATEAARRAEESGAGRVSGFGSRRGVADDDGDPVSESDLDTAVAGAFGHPVKGA